MDTTLLDLYKIASNDSSLENRESTYDPVKAVAGIGAVAAGAGYGYKQKKDLDRLSNYRDKLLAGKGKRTSGGQLKASEKRLKTIDGNISKATKEIKRTRGRMGAAAVGGAIGTGLLYKAFHHSDNDQ